MPSVTIVPLPAFAVKLVVEPSARVNFAASAVAAALDVKLFHLAPPMTTVASLVDCAALPTTT